MKQIPAEVIEVLKQGRVEDGVFFLPPIQLDRTLYTKVDEVLKNAGAKWNRSKKGHVLSPDSGERLQGALETGKTVNEKQVFQFFETPSHLADRMVELAELQSGMMILEPSAGHGAIAEAIARYESSKPLYNMGLIMVEVDPKKCAVLEAKQISNVLCEDFMGSFAEEYGMCDRVIMNPPFAKQQDIDHVQHAYEKCLYPGGKLVAIMSPGFTFRTNKKSVSFRALVESYGSWERLPTGTFREAGTNVNTVLVVLNKPVLH